MTIELSLLLWSAALTLVLVVISVIGTQMQIGLPPLIGNREGMPEIIGWAGRARRAHRNMLENLLLFAILVLTAKAVGVSSTTTELGAYLFFWVASPTRSSTSPACPGSGRPPGRYRCSDSC